VIICLTAFVAVFSAHLGYHAWREHRVAAQWVSVEAPQRPSPWARYFERQDYYLGYSYALAAAFTAFAILKTVQQRRREARGILSGLTLMGALYVGGCYLIGCCGSPLLGVYLSLFGASFLGALKPIVAGVTTVSVLASGVYTARRSRRPCCDVPARREECS
jgi:hypothetical protein